MHAHTYIHHSKTVVLFVCLQLEVEEEHSTVSRINIIDLAGSERSKVAGTSGDRLKVGVFKVSKPH